ncbi:MAG: murein biosynthesis integral membrane protein MurJ [Rhizobiales bacterium]|nr:murein biosynthesis integral membrane protein MurJ [Hyphomicrobiales bacterium]
MQLFKSAATVGGLTMISRLLGFVRDVMMAAVIGTGPVADAFVVAFRFPNLFRRLFGEGAFNSAFVPLFAKRLEGDGPAAARDFGEEVLAGLLFVLLTVLAIAEIAMPWLMYLFAPGFASEPGKFELAVTLTRIAFPYLVFMSLVALLAGVLNSLHRFTAAAAAPIVLNIVMISVLAFITLAGWGNTARTGKALVWGVSAAGAVQLVMLWVACRRAGMPLKLRRPQMTDRLRRLIALGIPGVVAGGITQLNLVISTIIASLQSSAPSWLYYADRIYQLPLGVVGVAIGVVLLPELSRSLRAGDDNKVRATQNRSVDISMFLTIPAAVALMAIPYPVIQVLFERGAFVASDTQASAAALAAFAAGLPSFVLIKIFSPGFFAREDTRTPMYFAAAGVAVNILAALALFPFFGHVGIAAGTTMAGWLNAGLLGFTLTRRGHFHSDPQLQRNLRLIIAASLAMGLVLIGADHLTAALFNNSYPVLFRSLVLAMLVGIGAGVYFGITYATGVFRPRELKQSLKRK